MRDSLQIMNIEEMADLLENKGILQEVNRTFFNPLGMMLELTEDMRLQLLKTDSSKGVILHTIDMMRKTAYNLFRGKKHKDRQLAIGFIIQVRDFIRADKIQEGIPLTPPEVQKLGLLLSCVDESAYLMKKILMENSKEKDVDAANINFDRLSISAMKDIKQGNILLAALKMIMVNRMDVINYGLQQIQKSEVEKKKLIKK